MRIAIIGRTQVLYESALKLVEEGHQIACVITAAAAPEYTRTQEDFRDLAKQLGASFFQSVTLRKPEIRDACEGLDIGVSINWVSIVAQREIDLFQFGILNVHNGDLPRYRGNAAPNWAIINGEERITTSVHLMEGDRLDSGRIVSRDHFKVGPNTTITEFYAWWEEVTPGLLVLAIRRLEKDATHAIDYADPDSPHGFRGYPRLPLDGYIDWNLPADEIHNLVRAVTYPFSGAYTFHVTDSQVMKLYIFQSRLIERETNDLATPGQVILNDPESGQSQVMCGEGVLGIAQCCYENEESTFLPGKTWKSIRMRLGVRPEDWLWLIEKSTRERSTHE